MWEQPRTMFTVVAVGLGLLVGCASAPPAPTVSQQFEAYPFREAKAKIAIGVNPCTSQERVKEALPAGADYLAGNVLPLQILLRNDGQDDLFFKVENVRLVWSDGGVREALSPAQTYEAIKDEAGGMTYVGLFGVFGVPAMLKQRENVMKEVMNASAKDGIIGLQKTVTGVLFYPLHDADTSLRGAKIRLVLQNPASLTETAFELPLSGDLPKNRKPEPPKQPTPERR